MTRPIASLSLDLDKTKEEIAHGRALLATSERYRDWVRKGFQGIKPGWCRVGFHYTMDDAEAQYVIEAVEAVARFGHRFLPLYAFDATTGLWTHRTHVETHEPFSIEAALACAGCTTEPLPAATRRECYARYFEEAERWAARLGEPIASETPAVEGPGFGELQFFNVS